MSLYLSKSVSRLWCPIAHIPKNIICLTRSSAAAVVYRPSFCSSAVPTPPADTTNRRSRQSYSRFSANLIMSGSDTFRVSDYDCVGFDLDNTLLRYKIANMVRLEYESLAQFLVTAKGYSGERLMRPFDEQLDFLQRGLIIDLKRGNVLKVAADGYIRRAAHGTRFLDDAEVVSVYGEARKWSAIDEYTGDLLSTWDGPAAESMRTLLDFFDLPLSLVFGRCVDTVDAESLRRGGGGDRVDLTSVVYDIWPDILEGVYQLYSREHFQSGDSPYFEALKQRPADYIHVTSPKLIAYLRTLRATKTTFLLTGSHIDFADFTATQALGADWRSLFDVVVCFAKKPGFFKLQRPFLSVHGTEEAAAIGAADMHLNEVYSQGNWSELMAVLGTKNGVPTAGAEPKVLYVGDNLVQDVFAPFALSGCDTIAVVEELLAEGVRGNENQHDAGDFLCSQGWGSYFGSAADPTLWSEVIQRNARLCVAEAADLADQPLDHEYRAFTPEGGSCSNGFWPHEPRHYNEN